MDLLSADREAWKRRNATELAEPAEGLHLHLHLAASSCCVEDCGFAHILSCAVLFLAVLSLGGRARRIQQLQQTKMSQMERCKAAQHHLEQYFRSALPVR